MAIVVELEKALACSASGAKSKSQALYFNLIRFK
jgi:hypothetical protein